LSPSFWDTKTPKIGVALEKNPTPAVYRDGPQGLLDLAINAWMASGLKVYLQKVNPEEFNDLPDRFVQKLQERGFSAKRIQGIIDLSQFPKNKLDSSKDFIEVDLQPFTSENDVDLLLLISVERYGTMRNYYGFFPVSPPRGFFQAKGRLINPKNSEIQWQAPMGDEQSAMAVEGDWDQPPDYPNITTAVHRAEKNAIHFLDTSFFGGAN
jgi:hypothetical protein